MISSTCYVTFALSTISTATRSGQSDNRNKFIMSWIPCSNYALSKNLTQTPGILIKISLTEFNIINLSLLCKRRLSHFRLVYPDLKFRLIFIFNGLKEMGQMWV